MLDKIKNQFCEDFGIKTKQDRIEELESRNKVLWQALNIATSALKDEHDSILRALGVRQDISESVYISLDRMTRAYNEGADCLRERNLKTNTW